MFLSLSFLHFRRKIHFSTLGSFAIFAFIALTKASTSKDTRGVRIPDEAWQSCSQSQFTESTSTEGSKGRPHNPGGIKTKLEVLQTVRQRRRALGKRRGQLLEPHERIFPKPEEFNGLTRRQVGAKRKALMGLKSTEAIPEGMKGIPSIILLRAAHNRELDPNLTYSKSIERQIVLYKQELNITDATLSWTTVNLKDYEEGDDEFVDVAAAAEARMNLAGPSQVNEEGSSQANVGSFQTGRVRDLDLNSAPPSDSDEEEVQANSTVEKPPPSGYGQNSRRGQSRRKKRISTMFFD